MTKYNMHIFRVSPFFQATKQHLTHLDPDHPSPPALFPYCKTPDHPVAAG